MRQSMKTVAVEVFAIAICYIIIAWPMASATTVNIIFNGQTQETADMSPNNLLNKQITSVHDPSDVTWTNVNIVVTLSSASMSHSIEKIYLYKCRKMNPSSCVLTEPQVFDNWVDIELAWKDISEQEGTQTYPQTANLLTVIKMLGPNGRTSWVGSWDTVKRTEYNVFNTYSHEISALDFYAKSADLVQPAKSFMESYQMIPFNWASKVVFQGASALYGLGASEDDLRASPPRFQSAQPQGNEVSTINKDNYFVLSDTSSGTSVPMTLNLNPSFTCGDGFCEADLGETMDNCCYDCGCLEGEYCDTSQANVTGACRDSSSIGIQVQPMTVPEVTDCSHPFEMDFKLKVNTPPSTLPGVVTSYITLDDDIYTSTCTKSVGNEYTCPVTLNPQVRCGTGSKVIGPNTLNVSISYNDGANVVSKDMSTSFGDVTVNYDCGCQDGFYCDAGELACMPEGSIGLQILNVTSYMKNYNAAGDNIIVTARVTNPPTDLTTPGTATYVLGSLFKSNTLLVNGTSGNAQCSGGPNTGHVYVCSIPIHITNYDHESAYYYRSNTLSMTATYSNGGTQVVRDLVAPFSDITIPSYRCGDGTCNIEEDEENCCLDCGCTGVGKYCDTAKGCNYISNVSMSIVSVSPKNVTDCKRTNHVNITVKVNNVPSNSNINYVYYFQRGELRTWGLQCSTPNPVTGISDCMLQIPPIDDSECQLPYYLIDQNRLNMTISFPNGNGGLVTRYMSAPFDDIKVIPQWHCGQFGCESDIGESGANCCIDCGCADGEYCDYHPQYNPDGICMDTDGIELIIDDPSAPVYWDTCEKSHRLNVKARIRNQPSGMQLENWYAEIDGESTGMIICKELRRFRTSINSTYNCTILVPSVATCSQGDVYNYDNNSISFFISYTDGMRRRATQTLTSTLPNIEVKQSIRTVYDITQDAIAAMKAKLQEILDAMQQLMDMLDMCIQAMIVIAVVGIVATLAVGFGGDKMFSSLEGSKFSERVTAMSSLTTAASTTIQGICNMISQSYQMFIRMKEVEMDMIEMNTCLELYQHELDVGNCDGREQSCFSAITGCLDFGSIKSFMNDADQFMDNVNSETSKIAKSWNEFGEAWDELEDNAAMRGYATMTVSCKTGSSQNTGATECCNKYPLTANAGSQCGWSEVSVRLLNTEGCEYPVIFKSTDGGSTWTEVAQGTTTYSQSGNSGTWSGDVKFGYGCYDDVASYVKAKQDPETTIAPTSTANIKLGSDTDNDCYCTESGLSGGSGTGTGGTTGLNLNGQWTLKILQSGTSPINNKPVDIVISQSDTSLGGTFTGGIVNEKVNLNGQVTISGYTMNLNMRDGVVSGNRIVGTVTGSGRSSSGTLNIFSGSTFELTKK
ncbi:MAG: hypothetical protein DRO99_02825 [Candidatus Aenigmatarchaeota archaeon]|nr:MAG: hypothetical protein DRO99_02825 [Candidatus Aenigmarchaeota archaeon]